LGLSNKQTKNHLFVGLFTILSYVDKSAEVPAGWNQSNPYVISATADQVKLS
jgi:hypothetical protein